MQMRLFALVLIGVLSSCARTVPYGKGEDPKKLFEAACSVGRTTRVVKGSSWLRVKSKDASGQLPAFVKAEDPAKLTLEANNPFGGVVAVLRIDGQKYTVEVPERKKTTRESGYGSWSGIPLRWATELFLGRVPCPTEGDRREAVFQSTEEGDLIVQTKETLRGADEKFVYRFREWNGKAWPESVGWERGGPFSSKVEFIFDEPESGSGSPLRWEAKSAQGEVKLRWRDRQVETK